MFVCQIAKLREELKVKGGQTSKNDTQFEQHLPNALMATLSMENEKMKKATRFLILFYKKSVI